MLPILNIGPLAIQVPGLVILIGLWAGLTLAERYAPRFGVKPNQLYNLVFVILIAGVVGARLAYVIRYPQAFAESPFSIISLNFSLLDPWGGVATGFLAGLIYGQRKQMEFWATLDALTPVLAVLAVALHLAQLASGDAFGAPTDLPWGFELWGARRHPTQIYNILSSILILAILWPGRLKPEERPSGSYFLKFVIFSAAARLLLEAFRGDSVLLPGGLRLAQVIAWFLLAISVWKLYTMNQTFSDETTDTPTT